MEAGGFNLHLYANSNEELRRRVNHDNESLAGKTSATLAISHMPVHINQAGNFNINSESETQQDMLERNYISGSALRQDELFHIKRENNPILIMHNPSNGELLDQSRTNMIIRKSQEKVKNEMAPYFSVEENSRQGGVAAQSLLTNSNKVTFRNMNEPPTLTKQVPFPVIEAASPTPQAQFDLQNFNAFTGNHHLAAEAKDKKQKRKRNNDSDDEFARGDSIPISETLKQEINFIKQGIPPKRYDPFIGGDSQRQQHESPQKLFPKDEGETESEYDEEEEEASEAEPSKPDTDQYQRTIESKNESPKMLMIDDSNFRQSVKDLQPAPSQPLNTFNDDAIYNRLPKNFFVQEAEEQFDLSEVMASIKKMRADFVGYMNESKVQNRLEQINEMILQPPEKFIEKQLKAMGLEGGESLLFEKVLSQTPSPSLPESVSRGDKSKYSIGQGQTMTMREAEPSHPSILHNRDMFSAQISEDNLSQCQTENQRRLHSRGASAGRVQFQEPQSLRQSIDDAISQKGNVDEIEDRISRKDFEQFPKPGHDIYGTPKSTNAPQGKGKAGVLVQQQAFYPKQLAIKNLKMADYFKGDLSAVEQSEQMEEPPLRSRSPSPIVDDLAQPIKEQLVERLEQEILGNIDVNFLFNKGERLRHGLIDPSRLYKIMLKIKEVAQKQVYEKGMKQIDYTEIVQFLEEEDQFLTEGQNSQIHMNQNKHLQRVPTAEPRKTKLPQEEIDDSQWVQIVDFMRKNPKLMLQMLPESDPTEEDIKEHNNAAAIVAQSMATGQGIKNLGDLQAAKEADDAKRLAKLKALSAKFNNNKKDFLDAIDRFQEKEFQLGSPKGKEREVFGAAQPFHTKQRIVQVKSISSNQRKVKRAHAYQQNRANQSEIVQDITSDQDIGDSKNRTMIYEKQFQYTSANMAKGVYSSLPYALPPQNIAELAGSGSENENRSQNRKYQQHSMLDQLATKTNGANRKLRRPNQSQNQKDLGLTHNRSFNKGTIEAISNAKIDQSNNKKGGGLGTNMSNLDATTMTGGTATGNFTNFKNYRNNITAQIKTISQEDASDGPVMHGAISTASMFQKFHNNINKQESKSQQRRPITASAAVGGGGFKPIRIDPKIYSDQSSVNLGPTVTGKQLRLPSASGMSSNSNQFQFKAHELASSTEIPPASSLPKYQHFAKFVSEKRITWMTSGQQIQATAKQTEDLNNSLKSSFLIQQVHEDDQVSSQPLHRLSPEPQSNKGAELPPQVQKRTKTQRQEPRRRIIAEAETVEVDQDLSQIQQRDTSPEKKTQQYIKRIAPSIKHKDTTGSLYPKFVGRMVKRQTPMGMSNQDYQSRISETASIDNASSAQNTILNLKSGQSDPVIIKGLNKKRVSMDAVKVLSQHIDDGDKSIASSRAGDQYPSNKFVKDPKKYKKHIQNVQSQQQVRMSSSSSANRVQQPPQFESATMVNSEVQTSGVITAGYQSANEQPKQKMTNQHMQTRIGGIKNRFMVSPSQGGFYGGDLQNCNFDDCYSSNESEEAAKERKRKMIHSKMVLPVVDWAFTPLFSRALKNDISFNEDKDLQLYEEKEVDYVIDMMKNKYKDFKRSDIMRPFYLKAQLTLHALFVEQGQESHYQRLMHKYKEITIENTMKLLIRCKLNFNCRLNLFEILKSAIDYELHAVQFKDLVQGYHRHKVDQQDIDKVKAMGDKVIDAGHQMLIKIRGLRLVHTQYKKVPFIFRQRDYVTYVKNEMNEVRRLMSVFKIRTEEDIAEDERKQREFEEMHLQDLLRKQQILQLEQELTQAGVDLNPKNADLSEDEYEEIEEVDPNSLLSPLRVVP